MTDICPMGMATVPMMTMELDGSKASPCLSLLPGSQLGEFGACKRASSMFANDCTLVGCL